MSNYWTKYTLGLNDYLVVGVRFKKNEKIDPENLKKSIQLVIDGNVIKDLKVETHRVSSDLVDFKFQLESKTTNEQDWKNFLGTPQRTEIFQLEPDISIRADKIDVLPSDADIHFIRTTPGWITFCIVLFGFYLVILLYFTIIEKTNLLRDTPSDLSALSAFGINQDQHLGPYSLGKIQMAFWFTIFLFSYLFIWAITKDYNLLKSGTLGLIGISALTALSAVSINKTKVQEKITQILKLQNDRNALDVDIANLSSVMPEDAVTKANIAIKSNALKQIDANIASLENSLKVKRRGLLKDILFDAEGVSFHRLQMVTWTIVLGFIFLYTVWDDLDMPEYSSLQLALLGITSGTYLGFKFPEKES